MTSHTIAMEPDPIGLTSHLDSLSSQTEYRLYLLETYMGYPDQLTLFDSTICNYWSHVSYHMNWGWAGQSDGYYDDPNVTTSGITYHFTSDRKDLLITP